MSTDSNVCSAEHMLARAEYTFALAARLRDDGCAIEIVDLGGGIGAPLGECRGHRPRRVRRRPSAHLDRHPSVAVILELGRYPVAESGAYVVSVAAVKRSAGGTFALVDGGINHLYPPTADARWRSPAGAVRQPRAARARDRRRPLLDADDVLAEAVEYAAPEAGDLLAIPGCGAYGYTHGLHGFCLHPTPAEVLWDGERLHLVRERGDLRTVTAGQHLPEPRAVSVR